MFLQAFVCSEGGGGDTWSERGVSHLSEGGVHPFFLKWETPLWVYGQCAIGTHPTGMHTSLLQLSVKKPFHL